MEKKWARRVVVGRAERARVESAEVIDGNKVNDCWGLFGRDPGLDEDVVVKRSRARGSRARPETLILGK